MASLAEVQDPKPHPLWQFFHVPEKATRAPGVGDGPLKGGMGSLDVQGEGDGEARLNSGAFIGFAVALALCMVFVWSR